MHIAASNPTYINLSDITAEAKKQEEEVSTTKAKKLFEEFKTFEAARREIQRQIRQGT